MTTGEIVVAAAGIPARTVVSADPKRFEVDAWGNGTLVSTTCADCGTTVFGTHHACLACASQNIGRIPVTGRGAVLSYSVIHRPSKDWWGSVPYTVAEVQTEDDVVVVAGMVVLVDSELPGGQITVGLPVELRRVLVEHPEQDALVAVFQWAPLGSGS
jgi:uncharacterized OB-fold protein